jgi:hypothetical protein
MDEETSMLEAVLGLQEVVGEAIEEMDRIREKLKWGRLSSRLYEYFEGLPSTLLGGDEDWGSMSWWAYTLAWLRM